MTTELETSFLSAITSQVRAILEADSYIIDKCQDSLKDPLDSFVRTEPLQIQHLQRDYTISVYHTCKEFAVSNENGLCMIQAPIYIDLHRKSNKKDSIPLDKLDIFARTVLNILYGNDSLNGTVHYWEFNNKQIWKVSPDTGAKTDKMQESKLVDYIAQITILCHYSYNFSKYY